MCTVWKIRYTQVSHFEKPNSSLLTLSSQALGYCCAPQPTKTNINPIPNKGCLFIIVLLSSCISKEAQEARVSNSVLCNNKHWFSVCFATVYLTEHDPGSMLKNKVSATWTYPIGVIMNVVKIIVLAFYSIFPTVVNIIVVLVVFLQQDLSMLWRILPSSRVTRVKFWTCLPS